MVEMFAVLHGEKGDLTIAGKTKTDEATTFHIETTGKGFHFFKLYAYEVKGEAELLVATYCIIAK